MFASGSIEDPFWFDREHSYTGVWWTTGKVPSDPRLVAGQRTAVFISAGQSNIASSELTSYTVTNVGKVDNLNVYDGGVYQAKDPLCGTGNYNAISSACGNWQSRLADKLINAGTYDRVILVPVAIGGRLVSDWSPSGLYHQRLIVAARRCAEHGYPISAFFWAQGESDHGISQASYQGHLQNMIASVRSHGFAAPWLVAKSTFTGGVTDANIRAAQAAVVNGVDIFAGPDTDTLNASYREEGIVHWTAAGANAVADLWKTAIEAAI